MASSSKDTPEDGAMLKSRLHGQFRRLMFRTDSHPPRRTLTKEVDDADEAERGRRAHVEAQRERDRLRGTASNRAATAKTSKEEMNNRMHQREAATAALRPGAATAHLTFAELAREAAQMTLQQADRNTPIMVGMTWTDDWTIVDDREEEMKLRDSRHRMMRQYLIDGCYVRYKSSGNSMWPLVQSNDLCTFHPVQAVTGQKEASEIVPKIEI